jgi:hypothetical protein
VELWAILVSAAAGLAAGQIGAWLQARRDQRVELQRQAAETERLRLQLTEGREQHERDRSLTDTHEWRERRLAAYQAVWSAFESMLHAAAEVKLSDDSPTRSAASDRFSSACRELYQALDLCGIIGTNRTRSAAQDFADMANKLNTAVMEFALGVSRISHALGQTELTQLLKVIRALPFGQPVEHMNEYIAQLATLYENEDIAHLVTVYEAVEVAQEEGYHQRETWLTAARAELGVPD